MRSSRSHPVRLQTVLSLVAIIVLVTLTGCGGVAPQVASVAVEPAANAAAPTARAAAPTTAPTAAATAAPTVPPRPLPPTVVSTSPDRGEELSLDAPVVITFDQPMDPASLSGAFRIEPETRGDVKVSGNALTFTPAEQLARGQEYRVTLAQSAAAANGLKLPRDVSFRFVAAGFLEVSSTQPADGSGNVTVDTPIIVAFNRPVVPLTTGDQASLPQPLVITPTVTGTGEWLNTSIYRFAPANGLAASTLYTVTVQAGLTDTTGGALAKPVTFSFRTTDPTITRWTPENNVNVRIERPISVTFSMPMDRASAEAAFQLLDPDGNRVAGSFNWNDASTELGFKPAEALKFGAAYRATIGESAKAANGEGSLRSPQPYAFQTVRLPQVIVTEPPNGATNYSPDRGVRFGFASPLNAATFVTGTVTVLPKPTRVMTYYNEFEGSLFVDFPKLPATEYTVTLSGKVADPYGNTLGQDYVLKFRTGDLDPLLQLNNQQQFGTYSAYTNTQAVVLYRNVPEVKFRLYGVTTGHLVNLSGRNYWERWNAFGPSADDLIHEWTRKTTAPRNQTAFLREPLLDARGQQLPPGVYYLEVGGAMGQRPPRQLIIRTNANVTLKASADQALAWVTDLKSGQPIPGVSVRFTDGLNDVNATTDKDGVASVKLPVARKPWDAFIAVAGTASGQGFFGVASSNWQDGIGSWEYGVNNVDSQPYQGYLYTDRPIYRPGQTVYWKAIIRRDNDAQYALPAAGQQVTVTINDEQGNLIYQQRQTLNPLGALDGSLELGPDATTGGYYINTRLSEEIAFGVGFQVAEYRKPEYEISAKTDKAEYAQGEQISVTAQANYFFGGPVGNARVRWTLMTSDAYFDYKGEGWYSFSDFDWWQPNRYGPFGGMITEGEGRTDATGAFAFTVPADIAKFASSQRFSFDITVQDINNQAVSTQATALVHKGAFYVGVAPRGYVLNAGDKGTIDVLTVDPQSQPAPRQQVDLTVSRVEWFSVREQLEDGQFYWATRQKKTGVVTQTVTTDANGAASLTWTPREPGEYKVDATARDAAGNVIKSGAYIWVSGDDYVAWRQENNDRIKLVADKDEYTVGDTAEVLIPSPYQGAVKALVTVERGRVIEHEVIELTSNSQVLRLPIEEAFAPNVYVSVVIVKGMDESSPAPSFKMGIAQLNVSTKQKQLTVIARPRISSAQSAGLAATAQVSETLRVAPREKIVWDVRTLDANGKGVPADVSLALVDKAVLTLAADPAGSIVDRFYSQRGLSVQTGLTLVLNIDRLVTQLAEEGKGGGGGGGGGGGAEVRTEFPDIAYWRASVTTDAAGQATVEVTLPDNLTTWVMDARAVTENTLVGQSKTELIATKALLVRPVLPRFFVAGDKADIAAIIHNTTQADLDVNFSAAARGLKLLDAEGGKATIKAGGAYKAVWTAEALDGEQIVVNMRADAVGGNAAQGRLSDAVQITLPVFRYSSPEVVGTAGEVELNQEALELVRLPENADTTRGELNVRVEPSLAAGMTGGLTYLEQYPYDCVEQIMSRFLPNVVTFAALKSLGIARPDLDAKLPQQVGVGLQSIYAKQHLDGGWGWWQNDKSSAAVTAYIVFGLARAKQADFTVDEQVLGAGTKFLQRTLAAPQNLQDWQLNQQAFALYALAEAGVLEPGRAGALFEVRERLSHYAKAYLALTFARINDEAAASRIATLIADLEAAAIVSATGAHWEEANPDPWNMNTDTRTTAIALYALRLLKPDSPLAMNAVRWLMSARTADRWATTQETAWAIISLTEWMGSTGEWNGNYSWNVALNGQPLGAGSVTPQNTQEVTELHAGIEKLLTSGTNALTIGRTAAAGQTGNGRLYYTAHLKTYLPVREVEPMSRGFTVSREYRLADCGIAQTGALTKEECPTITSAKTGDLIEVTVTLVAPHTSHYVIVEDPLPAGTEAVNTRLLTTSQTVQGPQVQKEANADGAPLRPGWWWTPTHVDLRDEKAVMFATELAPGTYEFKYTVRATLPGAFLTLPVTAYQMYFPEVWGRGAGGEFVVTE